MNRLFVTAVAGVLGLGSITASAADLTPDERSELRQRADEWQRVRAQNPNAGQGDLRLDRPQGDVKIDKPRGEVKAKPKGAKKSKRKPAKKHTKRSVGDVPGALVRK